MTTPQMTDVIDPANLLEAWHKVAANKGCGGVDGVNLADFAADLSTNLNRLREQVENNTYQPQPLLRVHIDKPNGDGTRPLSIPTISDRVLQTAVALVLTPVFEAEFEAVSFAYRRGRSVQQAIGLVEKLRDKGYRWVVDADIRRYFDTVDHNLLLAEVEKLVADKAIVALIRQWLTATVIDGKKRFSLTQGIAQGSPISPLLANLFLDHLDDTLIENDLRLVRYADDFVVLCKTPAKAQAALDLSADVLAQLQLEFNERKTRIVNFDQGFRFLGYTFVRSLALKTKYDLVAPQVTDRESVDDPVIESPVGDDTTSQTAENLNPFNTMQLAFMEADIEAEDFPEESPVAEPLDPPEPDFDDEPPAGHSPLLKTLYLLEPGSVLGKKYERFVVKRQEQPEQEIPAIHVQQIMVFGHSQITTQAMHYCLQQRIPVYLLSGKGKYFGVIDSFDTEPVLLQREQFLRASDPAFCLQLGQAFIQGKIANSRLLLKRQARHRQAPALSKASDQLGDILEQLTGANSLDQLRGFEGNAARIYFQAIAATLDPAWQFTHRNRQPPTDPVNALLSYGYTLLFYNIYTLLRVRGLNPQVGYLHPVRMGHPALVSDVMEEFRALVVDAVVFNMVLNEKLSPDDFTQPASPGEACLLSAPARTLFIRQLEEKLNAQVRHPNSQVRLDYRRCMEQQINQLAAVIRQREPEYQAMVLR